MAECTLPNSGSSLYQIWKVLAHMWVSTTKTFRGTRHIYVGCCE